MNIQNRDDFFTPVLMQLKRLKIFCSCSRFKTIPRLSSTIEIISVVVTIEQQKIFRSDLLFLLNYLNIFLMNSNKFKFGKMIEFSALFPTLQHNNRHTHYSTTTKTSLVY